MDVTLWHEVRTGQQPAVRLVAGRPTITDIRPGGVLPGSFNPRHLGHDRMADWVERHCGHAVEFELSIDNVDKPSLSDAEIARRLSEFGPRHALWITRAATFVDKAQLFPGATFLLGVDTMRRIADPSYYADGEVGVQQAIEHFCRAKCRFLVFGRLLEDRFRTLDELALPRPLAALCQAVLEGDFREDISSTRLRCQAARTTPRR